MYSKKCVLASVCQFLGILLFYVSSVVSSDDSSLTNTAVWQSSRYPRSISTNAIAIVDPDSALVSQVNMDMPWEQFIISGPTTVSLLGQLMVVSSKLDFSFRDHQPNQSFVFMRYPNSFRATLTQIADDGWNAFMTAHMNMNKIQASMQLVPVQVRIALQALGSTKSTPRIIAQLLPTTLREIERLGQSCVILANNTHTTFVQVMSLIGEVISMTETSRGLQETRLRQAEIELNVSRVMQIEMTKLNGMIKSHYNEARETVTKAQDEYSRALRRIPTGFKALLFDLGRAVISLAKTAGEAFIAYKTGGMSMLAKGGSSETSSSMSTGQSLTFGKLFSGGLNKALPVVKKFLTHSKDVNSPSTNPAEEFDAYKITFETFLGSLGAGKTSPLKQKASDLIQRGINLFGEIGDQAKQVMTNGGDIPQNVSQNLQSRFNDLANEAKPMAAAEEINGANVPPAPPSLDAPGDSSQNEKFVAQLSMHRLRDAENRYDKIFDQLKQNQEELAKLMGKIASLDMARVHYKEILELLREALHLLARVREQWGQLILFFAEVAIKAEITLGGTLGPFITQAAQAGDQAFSIDERLFYIDLLKAQAIEIDTQSQMLYVMSRTYVDMSSKYVMGRLAGLSKMLTAHSDAERNRLLFQLTDETRTTQQAVIGLINQRKEAYQTNMNKRRTELENFLAKLGGPDPKDQAAIEAGKKLLKSTVL